MTKLYPDAASALAGVLRDDMLIAAGGFGLCGLPERHLPNAPIRGIVQVRNRPIWLQRTQRTPKTVPFCAQTCKLLPKSAAVAQRLGRFALYDRIATQHEW